ncbi:MAG TPA: recombinase family protein [Acidimicrobiales bacterium]|nr:recombinase family protein [Acidimicrobiales bacterium]
MTTTAAKAPRYAFYGRVSTEDEQDPRLSFPRQLQNAERQVNESGGRIIAHYYDIESGTGTYAVRGSGGLAGFDIAIPRDGGLRDMLNEAARRPARFDRVIVESISRLSRNSSVAFRVEDELHQAGVRLCAADEPLEESFGAIVLRHVNIGIARGYHHELMVKSRQGQETSTRQGWHAGGVALYGYRFVTHEHPNPHKASRGIKKRTLELDPVGAPVVRAIYDWYLGGGMGLLQIRDRLNADPELYPPPVPVDPATTRGAWSPRASGRCCATPSTPGTKCGTAELARRATTAPTRPRPGSGRTNPPIQPSSTARSTKPSRLGPGPTSAPAKGCRRPSPARAPSATTSTGASFVVASVGCACGATTVTSPPTTRASLRTNDRRTSRPTIHRTCT